jgi:hypothetical protein
MKLQEAFSPEESDKIYANFLAIVNDSKRRDKLVRKHGANAENVAYGTAVNQVKKQAANNIEEPMDQEQKLKEMIQAALSEPLSEKKKSFPDLTGDGKVTKADVLKARGVELDEDATEEQGIIDEPISEDLDLGHTDNEPHMVKAELAHIAKYAMELYRMVDQFEGPQEVDFPGWWQSKITTARNMISSAKHYLEFELEEPKLDALAGVSPEEGTLDEKLKPSMGAGAYVDDFRTSKAPQFKGKSKKKKNKMAVAAYLSAKDKIKEVVLAKMKQK